MEGNGLQTVEEREREREQRIERRSLEWKPLNYWWLLVLYRRIMYTYSRKPGHGRSVCGRV